MNVAGARATALRVAVRVECFTVTEMVVEAAAAAAQGCWPTASY